MATEDWSALRHRLERRVIRVVDIASILLADAVIVWLGFKLVKTAAAYANSGDPYFEAARKLSHAVFLIMYVAYVAVDLSEYIRDEYRRHLVERSREQERMEAGATERGRR